jgi:hypothetical protein
MMGFGRALKRRQSPTSGRHDPDGLGPPLRRLPLYHGLRAIGNKFCRKRSTPPLLAGAGHEINDYNAVRRRIGAHLPPPA